MDWQPISTAPRDGTKFLIYQPTHGFYRFMAWKTKWGTKTKQGFVFDAGRADIIFSPEELMGKGIVWQPLPSPPQG